MIPGRSSTKIWMPKDMRFIIAIFCAAGVVLAGLSARAKVQNVFPKDKDAPINQVNMYFHGKVLREPSVT